ncbi:Tesmin [Myotis brandtii]|uniref:Tesmin n=1 Tax=Myotis brandtii TaxID=109478 RepID=S7P8R9_MYOBR|nr:Tesmin [Myotis brandtii]
MLDHGAQPAAALGSALPSGPALPAPPRITLAGYCDCFASGDFCNNCSCDACCSHLRHGLERFKAIKVSAFPFNESVSEALKWLAGVKPPPESLHFSLGKARVLKNVH